MIELIKQVPALKNLNNPQLPDQGGSALSPQNLENTINIPIDISCIVTISLIEGVRKGDYEQVIRALQAIKVTEIDAEKVLPEALGKNGCGYDVEKIILVTRIREIKNLQGGMMISNEQLASFSRMDGLDMESVTKLIEAGKGIFADTQENSGLVKLSRALEGAEWKLVKIAEVPGQGIKAVIVVKEKEEAEQPQLEAKAASPLPANLEQKADDFDLRNNPYLQVPAKLENN